MNIFFYYYYDSLFNIDLINCFNYYLFFKKSTKIISFYGNKMRSCIFQFCFTIKSEFCEINILISIMCNVIFLNQKWKDNKNFNPRILLQCDMTFSLILFITDWLRENFTHHIRLGSFLTKLEKRVWQSGMLKTITFKEKFRCGVYASFIRDIVLYFKEQSIRWAKKLFSF